MDLSRGEIAPISVEDAQVLMQWIYDAPIDQYNFIEDNETLDILLNNPYYVLHIDGEVIGFYCCGEDAKIPYGNIYDAYQEEGYLDFGLGLNPIYTGKGLGLEFMTLGLAFLEKHYNTTKFRLTVFGENIRARKLYQHIGFQVIREFPATIDGEKCYVMVRE